MKIDDALTVPLEELIDSTLHEPDATTMFWLQCGIILGRQKKREARLSEIIEKHIEIYRLSFSKDYETGLKSARQILATVSTLMRSPEAE